MGLLRAINENKYKKAILVATSQSVPLIVRTRKTSASSVLRSQPNLVGAKSAMGPRFMGAGAAQKNGGSTTLVKPAL